MEGRISRERGPKEEFLMNVLSRLPIKTLGVCMCVCRNWRKIILDDRFALLYFNRSPPMTEIMLLPGSPGSFSRTVFLVDPDKSRPYSPMLLPLNDELSFSATGIVNSCKGLVCLCNPLSQNPAVIWNPVTSQYVKIPSTERDDGKKQRPATCNPIGCECQLCVEYHKVESQETLVASGVGFSRANSEYKVLRIFDLGNFARNLEGLKSYGRGAEIYVLREGSWRSTNSPPQIPHTWLFGTCFEEETIYWVCADDDKFDFIVSFDFGNEQFEHVRPPPAFWERDKNINQIKMQELKDHLSIFDYTSSQFLDIWFMKKSRGRRLWTKDYTIPMSYCRHRVPLKFLNEEELLMIEDSKALVSYNCKEMKLRHLKIRDILSDFEAMIFTPSFVSLEYFLGGDNPRVYSVKQS